MWINQLSLPMFDQAMCILSLDVTSNISANLSRIILGVERAQLDQIWERHSAITLLYDFVSDFVSAAFGRNKLMGAIN